MLMLNSHNDLLFIYHSFGNLFIHILFMLYAQGQSRIISYLYEFQNEKKQKVCYWWELNIFLSLLFV